MLAHHVGLSALADPGLPRPVVLRVSLPSLFMLWRDPVKIIHSPYPFMIQHVTSNGRDGECHCLSPALWHSIEWVGYPVSNDFC